MKRKISVLSLMLCIALTASLFAGCGGKKTGGKGDGDDISNYKGAKIVMYSASDGDDFMRGFNRAKDMWKEDTGGDVELIVSAGNWDSRFTKLTTLIATGEQVDAYWSYFMDCPSMAIKNIYLPVDKYLEETDHIDLEMSKKAFEFQGKTYAFATKYNYQTMVIIFNKTLFENNGETTPLEHYKAGNWTWDTFRQTCINMTQDQNNDGITDQYGFGTWLHHLFLPTAGLADYIDDDLKLTVDNPLFAKTAQFIQQCGFQDKSFVPGIWDSGDYFLGGNLAMLGERPSYIRTYMEQGLADELDFAPFPQDPDNKSDVKYTAWVEGLSILSSTANADAAAKYLKDYWAPAAADAEELKAQESDVWTGYTDEQLELLDEIKKNAYSMKSLGYSDFENQSRGMWTSIYAKGTSISSTVESKKPVLQSIIDDTIAGANSISSTFSNVKADFEKGIAPFVEYTSGSTKVADGAVTLTCPEVKAGENAPVIIHTDNKTVPIPAGKTYNINVKYKLSEELSGYDTIYFQIRSLAEIDNSDTGTEDTILIDSSSAKSGTAKGTIAVPAGSVNDYVLVASYTGAGGLVTIDEISITQ